MSKYNTVIPFHVRLTALGAFIVTHEQVLQAQGFKTES